MVVGHRVNRRKVWHDGRQFRTHCRRCKLDMVRGSGGWRPYNFEIDKGAPTPKG